jgi:3-aminobutyryl-CoA ammonia-lyase
VEIHARIVKTGSTSRTMEFECYKVIAPRGDISPSAADALSEPVLCVRASGTCVVPRQNQRRTGE